MLHKKIVQNNLFEPFPRFNLFANFSKEFYELILSPENTNNHSQKFSSTQSNTPAYKAIVVYNALIELMKAHNSNFTAFVHIHLRLEQFDELIGHTQYWLDHCKDIDARINHIKQSPSQELSLLIKTQSVHTTFREQVLNNLKLLNDEDYWKNKKKKLSENGQNKLDKIHSHWKKQSRFAGYNSKKLYDFYNDLLEREKAFIDFTQQFNLTEQTLLDSLSTKNKDGIKEYFSIARDNLKKYYHSILDLKKQLIESMLCRLQASDFYCDISHDEIIIITYRELLSLGEGTLPVLRFTTIEEKINQPITALKNTYILSTGLTSELAVSFYQTIISHIQQLYKKDKNHSQQIKELAFYTADEEKNNDTTNIDEASVLTNFTAKIKLFNTATDLITFDLVLNTKEYILATSPKIWLAINTLPISLATYSSKAEFLLTEINEEGELLELKKITSALEEAKNDYDSLHADAQKPIKNIDYYAQLQWMLDKYFSEIIKEIQQAKAMIANKIKQQAKKDISTFIAKFETMILQEEEVIHFKQLLSRTNHLINNYTKNDANASIADLDIILVLSFRWEKILNATIAFRADEFINTLILLRSFPIDKFTLFSDEKTKQLLLYFAKLPSAKKIHYHEVTPILLNYIAPNRSLTENELLNMIKLVTTHLPAWRQQQEISIANAEPVSIPTFLTHKRYAKKIGRGDLRFQFLIESQTIFSIINQMGSYLNETLFLLHPITDIRFYFFLLQVIHYLEEQLNNEFDKHQPATFSSPLSPKKKILHNKSFAMQKDWLADIQGQQQLLPIYKNEIISKMLVPAENETYSARIHIIEKNLTLLNANEIPSIKKMIQTFSQEMIISQLQYRLDNSWNDLTENDRELLTQFNDENLSNIFNKLTGDLIAESIESNNENNHDKATQNNNKIPGITTAKKKSWNTNAAYLIEEFGTDENIYLYRLVRIKEILQNQTLTIEETKTAFTALTRCSKRLPPSPIVRENTAAATKLQVLLATQLNEITQSQVIFSLRYDYIYSQCGEQKLLQNLRYHFLVTALSDEEISLSLRTWVHEQLNKMTATDDAFSAFTDFLGETHVIQLHRQMTEFCHQYLKKDIPLFTIRPTDFRNNDILLTEQLQQKKAVMQSTGNILILLIQLFNKTWDYQLEDKEIINKVQAHLELLTIKHNLNIYSLFFYLFTKESAIENSIKWLRRNLDTLSIYSFKSDPPDPKKMDLSCFSYPDDTIKKMWLTLHIGMGQKNLAPDQAKLLQTRWENPIADITQEKAYENLKLFSHETDELRKLYQATELSYPLTYSYKNDPIILFTHYLNSILSICQAYTQFVYAHAIDKQTELAKWIDAGIFNASFYPPSFTTHLIDELNTLLKNRYEQFTLPLFEKLKKLHATSYIKKCDIETFEEACLTLQQSMSPDDAAQTKHLTLTLNAFIYFISEMKNKLTDNIYTMMLENTIKTNVQCSSEWIVWLAGHAQSIKFAVDDLENAKKTELSNKLNTFITATLESTNALTPEAATFIEYFGNDLQKKSCHRLMCIQRSNTIISENFSTSLNELTQFIQLINAYANDLLEENRAELESELPFYNTAMICAIYQVTASDNNHHPHSNNNRNNNRGNNDSRVPLLTDAIKLWFAFNKNPKPTQTFCGLLSFEQGIFLWEQLVNLLKENTLLQPDVKAYDSLLLATTDFIIIKATPEQLVSFQKTAKEVTQQVGANRKIKNTPSKDKIILFTVQSLSSTLNDIHQKISNHLSTCAPATMPVTKKWKKDKR